MYPTYSSTTLVRNLLRGCAALIGAALLSAIGLGIANALGITLPLGPVTATVSITGTPLDSVGYTIRTQYATTGSCAGERNVSSVIGVPTPVDIGGSSLPDVLVTLVAVPTSTLGAPDFVQLAVTNLAGSSPLKALVEVILAPSPSNPKRIALGYDACEHGAPASYNSTVTATPSRITMKNSTSGPKGSLTVLGSIYQAVGSTRVDPTAISARLAPVPSSLAADVDILPASDYHALVTTNAPTNLRLKLDDVTGPKFAKVDALVEKFPGKLDVTFNPSVIGYTASAPIDHLKVDVESYEPAPAGKPATTVSRIRADLFGVPASSTITRTGTTQLKFSTPAPGKITTATINYASYLPGQSVPVLTPLTDEYLVGDVGPSHAVAEARLYDLSGAEIDTSDLVVVDVTHRKNPLNADVAITTAATTTDPVITRRVTAQVKDLPASARITYRASTGNFTYKGGETIGELKVGVHSSVPLVANTGANQSNIRLVSVPTGLKGRLNSAAKTFTATMDDGAEITTVEAQVTSGIDLRLADGQDGIRLSQEADHYAVFARISGLKTATVGWGDTMTADLTHKAGSFVVKANLADSDADGVLDDRITIDGRITDLPAKARIDYTAGKPYSPHQPEVPTTLVYEGSEVINRIAVSVVTQKPLVVIPESVIQPDTLKMTLVGMPSGRTTVSNKSVGSSVTTTQGSIGETEIELCSSTAGCRPAPISTGTTGPLVINTSSEPDGIWLSHHSSGLAGHAADYGMLARVHGLSSLVLGTGMTTSVAMTHTAGTFDVKTRTEKHRASDGHDGPSGYYVESVDVAVRDLPATVDLSFTPAENHVTYTGKDAAQNPVKIDSLVIDYSTGIIPVVGRAHDLHVDIEGMASGADLRYNFSDDARSIVFDAGTGRIDKLSIDALSDPSLLAKDSVASHRSLAQGWDGLMIWDLDDDMDPRVDASASNWYGDRINDPYILLARVTNLQRFSYTVTSDGQLMEHIDTDVDLVRDGGGPSLYVEVRNNNKEKRAEKLDGFANKFQYEGLYATYLNPPANLGYHLRELRGNEGEKMFEFTTTGSAQGESLELETNMGSANMRGMDVTLFPIPAGSKTNPGIRACVAPGYFGCVDPLFDVRVDGKGENPFSMFIKVAAPVEVILHMDSVVTGGSFDSAIRQKIAADITIDRRLAFSKSADTEGSNSSLIYLDTDYNAIAGKVSTFEDGEDDAELIIPVGTRAKNRWVEVERSGVHRTRNNGYLMCPSGFKASIDFLGIYNLNDDLCTRPILEWVSAPRISPDGQLYTIDLFGVSFADATPGDFGLVEGTHVIIKRDDPATDDGSLINFETTNWQWFSPFHLRVTVIVPPEVKAGNYLIGLAANTDVRTSIGNDPQAVACNCYLPVVR